ncbi:hypothetical protein M430DRAFT_231023 [Amorphotheca resinae ATCC 22711]|uniref:Uncharacterized protein n=1 Tax=Amorphotheca resinae ATCC 22711 TaxID=857342 RepID=A0A2T3B3N2_AMORE|nr:hypothetical protein M430DRAFT_231023 [Amorphotheca resinae ATCC 22711]PSS20240.1 hypothetical protein M430DRAFT_231023 [Amorphotheca resinae ATCC 22711]
MGNICGKPKLAAPDPSAQHDRPSIPSTAPPRNTRPTSSVPKKVGGPPRTLGSSSAAPPQSAEDARRKAAEAAEARARAAKAPKGKLASQLQEQKKQTRIDTLGAASRDERRMRDADAAAEARAFN